MARNPTIKPNSLPALYTCNVCGVSFELRLLGSMCVQSDFVPNSNQFHHSILAGICQPCSLTHSINSVSAVQPKYQPPDSDS